MSSRAYLVSHSNNCPTMNAVSVPAFPARRTACQCKTTQSGYLSIQTQRAAEFKKRKLCATNPSPNGDAYCSVCPRVPPHEEQLVNARRHNRDTGPYKPKGPQSLKNVNSALPTLHPTPTLTAVSVPAFPAQSTV